MTKLEQLKAAADRKDLAVLLGFKPKALAYLVYKKPLVAKYFSFQIQKRSGGQRTINAPVSDLKKLQARLSNLLQDCVSDINDGKKISGSISHGFRRKRSIITNGRCHRGKRWVFNVDLEGFFDSINLGRVMGFFAKNNNFQLQPEVATTIAQIACHNNALPQGSPCSPVISNLVAHIMDIRLAKLAEQCGCDYSRYADDLTFSTNKPIFPKSIATKKTGTSEWKPGKDLARVIQRSGFSINSAKTRMQYCDSRQDVTGLVINSKVNVRREYERSARAMVNSLMRTGSYFTVIHEPNAQGQMEPKNIPGSLIKLQGILSFIDHVKKSNWNDSNPRPEKRVGHERTYRDFLFHKEFYASDVPLILCEGKTDNIYLKCAIRRLAVKFPNLIKKVGNINKFSIRFMSYTDTTARMLNLSGGTGELNLLVSVYSRQWKKHSAGHLKQPVIIVVDNDAGSKGLFGAIAGVIKKPVTGKEKFIHVCHNLYVVPTPKTANGSDTMIEDFFDPSLLQTKLGGKKFNPGKPDTAKEYGKYVFAERIVRPNQATIDFSKFRRILNRIDDAIQHYAAQP
jgi:RNA-directed DNA polymerase